MAQAFVDQQQAGFDASQVEQEITKVLEAVIVQHGLRSRPRLELEEYFQSHSAILTGDIAQGVQSRCDLPGYRVLIQVTCTSQRGQDLVVAQKCRWHPEQDRYIQVTAGGESAILLVQAYFVRTRHFDPRKEAEVSSAESDSSSTSSEEDSSGSDSEDQT